MRNLRMWAVAAAAALLVGCAQQSPVPAGAEVDDVAEQHDDDADEGPGMVEDEPDPDDGCRGVRTVPGVNVAC